MGVAPLRLDTTASLVLTTAMVIPVLNTVPTITGFVQEAGPAASLVTIADIAALISTAPVFTSPMTLGAGGAAFIMQGTTVASATDATSGAITFKANIGRGTGAVGGFVFQVPLLTSTGTTAQTLTNAVVMKGSSTTPMLFFNGAEAIPNTIIVTSLATFAGPVTQVSVGSASPIMSMIRLNGTLAVPTVILNTERLGSVQGLGAWSATTVAIGAKIDFLATENWVATSASGTKIGFFVTPNTTTTSVIGMTLDQDKSLTVVGKFGCNAATAQAAATIGAALNAYGAGVNGLDTAGNMAALHAQVVAMAAALKANGIAVT